jgi:hypothetical protein
VSAAQTSLPVGFEALQPFVADWAVESANARLQRRLSSSPAERTAFFEAARPLLAEGLAYLDKTPLRDFDDRQARLMRLLLSFAHVALAVETQGDDEPKHAADARFITITRAPADH